MANVEKPYKQTKKKKLLRHFIVVTDTNLPTHTSTQSAFNAETKELYIIKNKCKQCDIPPRPQQKPPLDVSQRSTTSSTSEQPFHFDSEWLNDQDRERLEAITYEEKGEQRRAMRKSAEIIMRQRKNKLNLLNSLRIHSLLRLTIEQRIQDALDNDSPTVNLDAFLILEDGTFMPYNVIQGIGVAYELVKNKHPVLPHIDRGQLFIEMMQHQTQLRQLLHLFRYLDHPPPEKKWGSKLAYVIYKRKIELLDGHLVDNLDFWDHVECLFEPKVSGYYYAIIVCFDLLGEEKPEEISEGHDI